MPIRSPLGPVFVFAGNPVCSAAFRAVPPPRSRASSPLAPESRPVRGSPPGASSSGYPAAPRLSLCSRGESDAAKQALQPAWRHASRSVSGAARTGQSTTTPCARLLALCETRLSACSARDLSTVPLCVRHSPDFSIGRLSKGSKISMRRPPGFIVYFKLRCLETCRPG